MWMMRDGSPTCWSGVWVVTFFEYVTPSYLKLKNSQVFGKEQKHVSNWVLERGLPKVTLVKEITSSPSYTMYFWWHCSWCGQWLYHPVMTSCTCPSFCYQNASALQQGLEWDISHLWWDLTPQYSVSRNNWPIATVCAHGIRGSSMLESTGQSLFFSRHLKWNFHSQLLPPTPGTHSAGVPCGLLVGLRRGHCLCGKILNKLPVLRLHKASVFGL